MEDLANKPWEDIYNAKWEAIPYAFVDPLPSLGNETFMTLEEVNSIDWKLISELCNFDSSKGLKTLSPKAIAFLKNLERELS
jgi:hypothetical protein